MVKQEDQVIMGCGRQAEDGLGQQQVQVAWLAGDTSN